MTIRTITLEKNATCGAARACTMSTAHGSVSTPVFMPVGTAGTVKGIAPNLLETTGSSMILSNTYHLMLRPGEDVVAKLGGLHEFMQWSRPILTDSGGFQVMSLSSLCQIKSEGVIFKSHIDGSKHYLTPEKSIQIQHKLGSDISMVLDECTPYPVSYSYAKSSMLLSLEWALRSKQAFIRRKGHGLFAIIQGSTYKDLREYSLKKLMDHDFDGYAIGGLAVGEGHDKMLEVLSFVMPEIDSNKARYLMGVGKPANIVAAVKMGIDMFDCVIPTRSGRNGQAFIRGGTVNIRKQQYIKDVSALDESCSCYTCKNFSKAYLNHLVKSREMLGAILLTFHNIQYYQDLMSRLRKAIIEGTIQTTPDSNFI